MKIDKISYKIICDIGTCERLAGYCIKTDVFSGNLNICKSCMTKLHSALGKKLGRETGDDK